MVTATSSAPAIMPGGIYNNEQLSALGFGERTLRRFRRAGMKCRYVGRRLFVSGDEIIRMLDLLGAEERWGSK